MIELERVTRLYQVGDQVVRALDGLTLSIDEGEYVSLMGPSGSGKSTLLHIVGLLDRPSSGRYRLRGRDVTAIDEDEQAAIRSREIGFVFQFFHLIPHLSALENVELPMTLAGIPPPERRQRARRALERLGLGERAAHRPDQL
ncbi:MAG: ATP-binding cassette domain-containing protein, partial [Deltaproteobacteria bacterium]